MLRRHFITTLLAMSLFSSPAFADVLMTLETKYGKTVIKLRPDLAPKHVEQITALANRHFYDNVVFHRVIDGFMAQTGDPTGTGRGKSDLPNIPAEFSKEKFIRGTVGMARGPDNDSANSQFFICFASAPYLEEQYTVIGEVVSGMDYIDKVKRGEPPASPDKIIKLSVSGEGK
ncbi:MAG: peptidylprolyl isomerase [Alphaproteobacteria bacterium]|nr:peptidylprolyl isomerase [Alphaproteobacteria bacterium]